MIDAPAEPTASSHTSALPCSRAKPYRWRFPRRSGNSASCAGAPTSRASTKKGWLNILSLRWEGNNSPREASSRDSLGWEDGVRWDRYDRCACTKLFLAFTLLLSGLSFLSFFAENVGVVNVEGSDRESTAPVARRELRTLRDIHRLSVSGLHRIPGCGVQMQGRGPNNVSKASVRSRTNQPNQQTTTRSNKYAYHASTDP